MAFSPEVSGCDRGHPDFLHGSHECSVNVLGYILYVLGMSWYFLVFFGMHDLVFSCFTRT